MGLMLQFYAAPLLASIDGPPPLHLFNSRFTQIAKLKMLEKQRKNKEKANKNKEKAGGGVYNSQDDAPWTMHHKAKENQFL